MSNAMKVSFVMVFFVFANTVNGQKVYDKMSKEICKCISSDKKSEEEMKKCMEISTLNNFEAIMEAQKVNSVTKIDLEKFQEKLMARLYKNCDKFSKIVNTEASKLQKFYKKDSTLVCNKIKNGEYCYILPNKEGVLIDTTFVTINGSSYMERMRKGKTYSYLKLKWKDDCNFRLTFIESNDPFKGTYSKKGDKYDYEIIQSNEEFFIIKTFYSDQEFHVKFINLENAKKSLKKVELKQSLGKRFN